MAEPDEDTARWRRERRRWEREELESFVARTPERRARFETQSGLGLERVYTPEHASRSFEEQGLPGEYPFLRGPYPTMYRARPWTMRQIAGFGEPEDTNGRLRYLIEHGQTGISVDFDMPTLMGFDSDDERSFGEVGREGVAIDHVDDLHRVFEGIDIGSISVSMTINPTAWILLAMFLVVAEEREIPWTSLSGTTQADIVKEFIAQKEWIYPVEPSLRIVRDMITFGAEQLPHWNPVNISGYHVREAGATAVQEVAFTIAAAVAYAEEVLATGMPFDSFAPRFSFYFIAHSDFLEETAKFRAARRLWARVAGERFGASKPESMRLRFHCQTAGSSLTAPQPLNNVVRGALQALAAVLGGAQSLHVSGMDEALAIPSELAMKVGLRTQQIILEESGVASTIDALGGSYAIEAMTDAIERDAAAYLDGSTSSAAPSRASSPGWFQQEIADVGVRLPAGEGARRAGHRRRERLPRAGRRAALRAASGRSGDRGAKGRGARRLYRASRDAAATRLGARGAQAAVVAGDANVMPSTIEAVRARATGGEIVEALRAVLRLIRRDRGVLVLRPGTEH